MKITVCEFGAQDGCLAGRRGRGPPPAGTVQMWKPPICAVNTMVLPSGDQSGSVTLLAPVVVSRAIAPPSTEIV